MLANGCSIPPNTTVGPVSLSVADLGRSQQFYEDVLGLKILQTDASSASLGSAGGIPLVDLILEPNSVSPTRRATGLFHFAILLPSRRALGRSLSHLAEAGWSLSGAGDHLVSEALYLNDPDGNGIELYADRPRETWLFKDGLVQMDTLSVDIDSLIREGREDDTPWTGLPPGASMGHVHLKVTDLEAAGWFYHEILGFDVMATLPQALFLSAGGYHHHIGLNTWMSGGSQPPPPYSVGLRSFDINLPGDDELQTIIDRASKAGLSLEETIEGVFTRDPSHNGVVLRSSR